MPLKKDRGIKVQFSDEIRDALEKVKAESQLPSLGEVIRIAVKEYLQNRGLIQ